MSASRSLKLDMNSEKSALHDACATGDINQLHAALSEAGQSINTFHEGMTPLHVAVVSGFGQACDVIQTLIESGADINAQTVGDEDTALHLVVEQGEFPADFNLVQLLLDNYADLTLRNRKLRTAYDCALAKGYYELASTLEGSMPPEHARDFYMQKIGEKYGPYIIAAVLRSDFDMLQENVNKGGNPNMLNKHGAGAIHYAITHCTLPVMQVLDTLMYAGADVNLLDYEGDTALNLAIKSQKLRDSGEMTDVVSLLKDQGTDPHLQDLDGKDAFALAEDRHYDDVLEILRAPSTYRPPPPQAMAKKASKPEAEPKPKKPAEKEEEFPDPNAPDENGLYPIHIATTRNDPTERHDLIENLIERGAEVSKADDQNGNTALHLCAMDNLEDSAQQLLDHGIDYTVKNNEGKTAYEIAKKEKNKAIVAAIEKKAVAEGKTGSCAIL